MRAKLADYAFENFQNRRLDELISLDTRKFRNYLNFLNYEDDMILSQMDLNSVPKLNEASTIKDLNDEDENQLSQIDLNPFKDRLSKEVNSQNNCVQNDTKRAEKFQKKLESSVTKYCCNYCNKIIFCNNVRFLKIDDNLKSSWIKNDSLGPINLIKEKNEKYTFCNSCANNFNRKRQINVFGDFGQLPDEIKLLRSYYEYKDLSLCSLYCNVYQPTNYGYWHMSGQFNLYRKKTENLKGTFGIIYQKESELPANKQNVQKALLWLKQNNVFYQNFLSAFERLDRYSLANNVFNGFPETNSGIILN
ncbi:hypothetical protein BpHYR1_038592 [Brachionus plicatilis]|uniref:Uncharacterized protein n=1 Tax=Brachionus plicatilis TaxID=10195 RepID=A0A3M7Q8B4_BRAPC|nr:hypothetical protein BpHYR1_038592 [Brachionus plicatilis]